MEYDEDIENMVKCCTPGEEFALYLLKNERIEVNEEILEITDAMRTRARLLR